MADQGCVKLDSNERLDFINNQLELKIGVTGHRRLDRPEDISAAIREVLEEIFAANSSKKPPLLVALSPLAEGADRLVAQEILATEGGRLQVILPLEVEDYLRDFESSDSRRVFQRLLEVAEEVTVLKQTPSRAAAYEAVGNQVVDLCDILIAIWDGKPARGRGGTAATVAYAKRVGKPIYLIDSSPPREPKPAG